MKICFIASYPPKNSGLAFYTQDLLEELNKLNKVDVIRWNYESRLKMLFAPLVRIGELWNALRNYDIVHVQYVLGEFMFLFLPVLCLLSIGKKAKLVTTTHEDYKNLPVHMLFVHFHNVFYSCFDLIMVHTNHHRSILSKKLQKKTVVIPFGTKPIFQKSRIKEKTILMPGFINPWKGHDTAVNAMPSVIKKIPDAKLIIVGKPYDMDFTKKIKGLVRKNKLKKNVEIHDEFVPQEQYRNFFCDSGIIILPYRRITMSAVLSDVVGFAKPCICSNLPAFREYTKGKALYFEPENSEQLAEQIVRLLTDSKLRLAMSHDLKNLAQEYSWKNVAKLTINCY